MLMKSLSLAAAGLLAPAAQAFLTPPELSESDIKIVQELELFTKPKIAEVQAIDLECPGCPLNIKSRFGQDIQVKTDRPNHLELLFAIEQRPEGSRLLVNDFELYPFADPFSSSLIAPQVLDDTTEAGERHDHHGGEEDGHRRGKHHRRPRPQPQRLGFDLHVSPGQKGSDEKFELIEVQLQIIEVGYSFVDDIPNLKINLVKDSVGNLVISTIEKDTPKKLVETPEEDRPEECTTTICQLIAAAHEKMEQLRKMRLPGCHGGKGGMGMRPAFHHGGPQGEHHHGLSEPRPGHMTMREHSWGKLFKNITSHILLPVLIGIVAGVAVSLIGMAVGTVIVALWRFFFRKPSHARRHSRRHSLHKASHKEAVVAEEKSGLLAAEEEVDAPPAYHDVETTTTTATKPAEEV